MNTPQVKYPIRNGSKKVSTKKDEVDIMKLLDELENREEGFTEEEFADWWNKNKNYLIK